jgi:[ribosomal protein S5]-alanine N-acetyltransferase
MKTFTLPAKIQSQRLMLERLKYEDAEEIFYTYASKPEATKYLPWPTHKRVEDTRNFLVMSAIGWEQGTSFSFAIRLKKNHRLIGSFGVVNNDLEIQFGYVLSPTQWGRGYATEACRTMLGVLSKTPGVKKLSTFVDAENVASVRVLQKSGLVLEGTFTEWFRFVNQGARPKDCVLMHLPLNEVDRSQND